MTNKDYYNAKRWIGLCYDTMCSVGYLTSSKAKETGRYSTAQVTNYRYKTNKDVKVKNINQFLAWLDVYDDGISQFNDFFKMLKIVINNVKNNRVMKWETGYVAYIVHQYWKEARGEGVYIDETIKHKKKKNKKT